MGDRGQIIVRHGEGPAVFLYSHWTGHRLPHQVQVALERGGLNRANDAPYLARIIFSRLIRGDVDGETGFGISSESCDWEHPAIVLDTFTQTVHATERGDGGGLVLGHRASMVDFASHGLRALGLEARQGGWSTWEELRERQLAC